MTSLSLSLKLSAVKTLSAVQRAINILKSAGPGAWYDPSDLTTLFQDSAGTTPVTAVEQPVGLILDKSQGLVLGPELFTGDYTVGASVTATFAGNEATATFVGGALTSTGANWLSVTTAVVPLGTFCVVEFDAQWVSGSDLQVGAGYTLGRTISAAGNGGVKRRYTATTAAGHANVKPCTFGSVDPGAVWKITVISTRVMSGNHLIQPTATSRPTLSSRYNLLTKTEQFDDAYWTKARMTVTANATTAPDGTLTADKLVESVDNGQHYVLPGMVTYSATAYTISIYAKAAERSVLQFVNVTAFPSAYVNFDLSAGTVSAQSGVDSVSITSVGNGWYRCSFVDTATVAGSSYGFAFSTQMSPTAALGDGYASDGTSGLFVWGAQLETVG